MFKWRQAERGGRFLSLSGALLLAAALALCAVQAAAAEEAVQELKTTPCGHIKPFKDADELMYQLYLSLEDDCLFKMDPKELSKIWGIPTLEISDRRKPIGNHYSKEVREPLPGDHAHLFFSVGYSPDYPHMSGFYLRRVNTNDYDNYPFFSDNEYPKLLPEPLLCYMNDRKFILPPQRGKYIGNEVYAWFNADKTRWLSLKSTAGIVHEIRLSNYVPPYFRDNCRYEKDWIALLDRLLNN